MQGAELCEVHTHTHTQIGAWYYDSNIRFINNMAKKPPYKQKREEKQLVMQEVLSEKNIFT